MKVIEALKKETPALSFEFFPPKTPEQETNLFDVISELKQFQPDFASITYGAMGTTRERTFFWAEKIKREFGIEPVAHLTCIAATKASISRQLAEIRGMGIENILALRGDPPADQPNWQPPADGFHYASELIAFLKHQAPEFCLGAAGFPEGHPSTKSVSRDLEHLKRKAAAGAEYVITQLFFQNEDYFSYVDQCRQAGIAVPIVPGIMPVTSLKQIQRMTKVCGATVPKQLMQKLEKHQQDAASVEAIGIEQAVNQCRELLSSKVPGIHFFVMNQAGPIGKVLKALIR